MENKTLLSIIIPLYNSEKVISNTLDNILKIPKTTLERIEILLIDDGSKDLTKDICNDYCQKYSFIKYYRKENGGVASSRNFGIKKASGKYLFFHDHDDKLEAKNVSNIIALIEDCAAYDIYVFNVDKVIEGTLLPWVRVNTSIQLDNNQLIESIFKTAFEIKQKKQVVSLFNPIWSVILKKDFLEKNDIFFERFCAYEDDFVCLLKSLLHEPNILLCDIKIYNWIIDSASTSHSYVFNEEFLQRVPLYIDFLRSSISNSRFDSYCKKITCDTLRNKYNMFARWLAKSKSKEEFKTICIRNNVRKIILQNKPINRSVRSRIYDCMFYLQMYNSIYRILKNK